MNKKDAAKLLTKEFPEKADVLAAHYKENGELLARIFFSQELAEPLIALLREAYPDTRAIASYVAVTEKMWAEGDANVKSIVSTTILERASDDLEVWRKFVDFISPRFRKAINETVIPQNIMMIVVPELKEPAAPAPVFSAPPDEPEPEPAEPQEEPAPEPGEPS